MEFLKEKNFKDYEYVEIFEDNGGTNSVGLTSRPSFRITLDDKEGTYITADSFLHIRGQIVNNAGVVITSPSVALLNSGWSLFKDASYKINNVPVEQFNTPGRVHQAHGLVNYSDDYIRGQGKNQMWALDSGDGEVSIHPQPQPLQVLRNDVVVAQTLDLEDTSNSRVLLSAGGTATQSIRFKFGYGPSVDYTTEVRAIVNGEEVALITSADLDSITYIGAAEGDTVKFYAGDEEIVYLNPAYDTPIKFVMKQGTLAGRIVLGINNQITLGVRPVNFSTVNPQVSNLGYEERRRRVVADRGSSTNKVFELFMPIREIFKILQEHPMAMRGASHILEFNKEEPSRYLHTSGGLVADGAKVKYIRVSWWVPRVRYQLETENDFISSLNTQKSLVWNGYRIEESSDFTSSSGVWDVATISSMPKRAFVWFQNSSRYDGLTSNSQVYDNLDLSSLYVRLNTDKFPEYEYEIDFGRDPNAVGERGNNYMRAYNAYLHACGNMAHNHDCLPAVSYEVFKSLYTIYCFEFHDRSERIFRNNQSIQMKVAYNLRAYPGNDRPSYRICCVFDPEKEVTLDYSSGMITKVLSIQ